MAPCERRNSFKAEYYVYQKRFAALARKITFCRIRDYLRKIIKKRETMLLGEERHDVIASTLYSSHIILHHTSSDMTLHYVPQK